MNAPTAAPAALKLSRVGYQINGCQIVADISLQCLSGTITALVGPNGAGKSTLLGLMAGDLSPTSGHTVLDGREISTWPAKTLARMRCVLLQNHAVRFAFSVREVVAMGRLPYPADPEQDMAIIDQAMAAADVSGFAERDVQTLSGGEASRVAFARVLAQHTPLLLLDEPTAALDLQDRKSVV